MELLKRLVAAAILIILPAGAIAVDGAFVDDMPTAPNDSFFPTLQPNDPAYRMMRLTYGSVADVMVTGLEEWPTPTAGDSLLGVLNSQWIDNIFTFGLIMLFLNIAMAILFSSKNNTFLVNPKYAKSTIRGGIVGVMGMTKHGDYAAVQILLFFCIGMAYSGANKLNEVAVDFLTSGQSMTGEVTMGHLPEVLELASIYSCVQGLNSALGEEYYKVVQRDVSPGHEPLIRKTRWSVEASDPRIYAAQMRYSMGYAPTETALPVCGKLTVTLDASPLEKLAIMINADLEEIEESGGDFIIGEGGYSAEGFIAGRLDVLQQNLIPVYQELGSQVQQIISSSTQPQNSDEDAPEPLEIDVERLSDAIITYRQSVTDFTRETMDTLMDGGVNDVKQRMLSGGAMMAGAYHYKLVVLNESLRTLSRPKWEQIDYGFGSRDDPEVREQAAIYRQRYMSIFYHILEQSDGENINSNPGVNTALKTTQELAKINSMLRDSATSDGLGDLLQFGTRSDDNWANSLYWLVADDILNPDDDELHPVDALLSLGDKAVMFGEAFTILGWLVQTKAQVTRDVAIQNSDGMKAPISIPLAFLSNTIKQAAGAVLKAGMGLMAAGVILTVYIPLIPLTYWLMGVLGYFLLTFYAVFAMPFWALSNNMPHDEGFAGHARQGYLIFLGVLTRPSMLLIGFYATHVLVFVFGDFMRTVLQPIILGINPGGTGATPLGGLLGVATALGLTIYLYMVIFHKIYSVSTELQDQLLRFVGGSQEQLGENDAARTIEQQSRGLQMQIGSLITGLQETNGLTTKTGESSEDEAGGKGKKPIPA